jgi:hypothetical protein
MSVTDQWEALMRGDVERGLTLMQESFNETPTPSTLVTLGLGYLWVEKYDVARNHFQDWMDRYRVTSDAYFALIGAAQWCLDDTIAACGSWKLGLGAQYIDMAGGIESPLLLWVGSILRPNDTLRREATQILREKVKDPTVRHWPGALAQFVLHQIDESHLEERSTEHLSQKIPPRRKWQVAFYKHVLELKRGGKSTGDTDGTMRGLVDTSGSAWSQDKDFLQLVRNPEFYIARHEASVGSVHNGGTATQRL